jgi:hypothetical protein
MLVELDPSLIPAHALPYDYTDSYSNIFAFKKLLYRFRYRSIRGWMFMSSLGVKCAGHRAEAGAWAIRVGGFPQWVGGGPTSGTL